MKRLVLVLLLAGCADDPEIRCTSEHEEIHWVEVFNYDGFIIKRVPQIIRICDEYEVVAQQEGR